MKTKIKFFTGAIAAALAATTLLTALDASARPRYDSDTNDRYDRYSRNDNGNVWRNRDDSNRNVFRNRDDYRRDDYRRNSSDEYYRYNRNSGNTYGRSNGNIYSPFGEYRNYSGRRIVRLPDGCRRVVYRDRTYYTRDNNVYYSYEPSLGGYIIANLLGIRIGY